MRTPDINNILTGTSSKPYVGEALYSSAKKVKLMDSVQCEEKKQISLICKKCSRKLRSTNSFKCRCEEVFCQRHRFFDQHGCTFDYKEAVKERLRICNPVIKKSKI